MKSHVHLVDGYTGVAVGILQDANRFLGTNSREADRDNDRLLSLIKHRGLGFLTLTLPAVGKIFDRALCTGRLPLISEPGFGKEGKGSILPRFLGSMWMRVFDSDGYVLVEPCITAIACLRQIFYCFKKARLTCDPERITSVLNDFKRVDKELPKSSRNWLDPRGFNDDHTDVHLTDVRQYDAGFEPIVDCDFAVDDRSDTIHALDVLQRVCDVVSSSFGSFEPEEWKPRHGRGAVADGRLGRDHKWSFPTWSTRLESVFPLSHFGYANVGLWANSIHQGESAFEDREVSGRLITVPKDMKGPRLIAAEPIAHQYCQQAILSFLVMAVHTGHLRDVINFNDQERSRYMALEASRDDGHATIDLSHASDSVSCWLVERLFRRNKTLLRALIASRTSSVVLTDGEIFSLQKFSTMGAATTFPVQTIFYACVCIAANMIENGVVETDDIYRLVSTRKWSSCVFGDDIIVTKNAAKRVVQLLTELGFEVNPTKTFLEGNFKESCGMDAYAGVEVTPTYVLDLYDTTRPSTLASVTECANNLHLAGWWSASEALESTVPRKMRDQLPIVAASSGCHGRISFCGERLSHLRSRWNADLHRREFRTISVVTLPSRISTDGNASLLQYFMEAPNPTLEAYWSSDETSELPSKWTVGYDERPRLGIKSRWVATPDQINADRG